MLSNNITISQDGHLQFAGYDTTKLAAEYGTPLYLMDEARLRQNCRTYRKALEGAFGEDFQVLYASKANCFKQIYRIMEEEQMGIDVVSSGELFTAGQAGFPMAQVYFHGNNKTDADIEFAMSCGVGYFVVDNCEELDVIDVLARRKGRPQKVLLRLTPGIDTHTYEAINTGKVDSKFGAAIETGQAEEFAKHALKLRGIELMGFHCHVGSQVFLEDVFERSADIMLTFMADFQRKHGYRAEILNLGGGYGVRYLESDPELDICKKVEQLAQSMRKKVEQLHIRMPKVLMEPGRSIVADAGMTLYTAGAIKKIPGYKNYVSIDGGMTDNPRYALYGAPYTVLAANRMNEPCTFCADVVGRCCESGDIIQPDILLPETIRRGDIIAVCTTGAYHYSMASNYNRIGRPATVMLADKPYIAVRRETLADMVSLDV